MADDPSSPKPTLQLLGGGDGWRAARAAALGAAGWRVVGDGMGDGTDAGEAPDAVLQQLDAADGIAGLLADPGLPALVLDSAVVVCAAQLSEADETALIGAGVEAVLVGAEVSDGEVLRALRQALGRKRLECAGRMAYATDLATGLPHQAQLLEHMAQLLALREREPAPMVLLVLRVDGFRQAAERLGAEAGNVLRRKVAVRLRGGLRASDVVAALGDDTYAVLLGRLEAKGDGERVAAKLVKAVQAPLSVAGQPCRVEAAVGLAVYPDHGKDAKALLARGRAGRLGGDRRRRLRGAGAAHRLGRRERAGLRRRGAFMSASARLTPVVRCLAVFCAALPALPATAQQETALSDPADGSRTRWAAAAGFVLNAGPEYQGASRIGTKLQPGLALRWGRVSLSSRSAFAVRGGDAGAQGGLRVELVRSERWRSSLGLRWDGGRDQDDSPGLRGLGDVRGTLRARLSLGYRLDEGWRLGGAWTADLLGRGGGWQGEVNAGRDWTLSERTGVGLSLALGFAGSRYLQSWFGVTPAQAASSGYPVYTPGSGLRALTLSASGRTQLDRRWAVFYGVSASQLLGPAAQSPLVQERRGWGLSVGLVARLF